MSDKDKKGGAGAQVAPAMGPPGLIAREDIPAVLPILPLRNSVFFPGGVLPLAVGRQKTIALIKDAVRDEQVIGVVTQRRAEEEDPGAADLYTVGTVARVVKLLKMGEDNYSLVVQGLARFKVLELVQETPYLKARIDPVEVIGRRLADIYREAGIPPGVFNYIPGSGTVVGDALVASPDLDLVAFTGSSATGLGIIEKCAARREGQRGITRMVCEMGGKNAAIIDEDADLDEVIPQVLQSAFGFQGQKCSACSRVIVLESIYEQFVARFVRAAASLTVGPAENPAFSFGPVADREQQHKILEYIEIGKKEGKLLYQGNVPEGEGYYVPMAIFADIRPEHRLAREEIFGPVLAIMRAGDFTTALAIANSTPQALTGSVFSRSPANLEQAEKEFRVGNLYLNRGCTGALVDRQPFGGFRLSGGGTKAGGSDYLLSFMVTRVVTENTMRRGFAPAE